MAVPPQAAPVRPAGASAAIPGRAYLELTKPRVVALMMFTAAAGVVLAAPGWPPPVLLAGATAGIGLVAASAAALNHVIERRLDARMARTRARPLPRGTIGVGRALAFAALLAASGLGMLLLTTNALCTALTLASMLGYAIVYTVLLKPRTPQNIVIGGAAGAAPPLLGWVAATGSADPGAWVLFLIILVWTPPHFWALAIHRRDDYARAGVPMLPVTHGVEHTSRRIVQYTIALVPLTLFVLPLGSSGALYALGAIALGARFVWWALRLQRDASQARATFRYSIVYLGALFALLLADHWLQQALA